MRKIIILLIISLIVLTGCSTGSRIIIKYDGSCQEENLELKEGLQSLVNYQGQLFNQEFDIKTTDTPATITICPTNCNYYNRCNTNSMAPTFTCNDYMEAYHPIKKDIGVGDIIGFKKDNTIFIHRIIGIVNESYITKGDNNPEIDKKRITYGEVVFKIKLIEYR